ncbi:MAG: nucleotidyl transferase AbiEii/AbiGii toxin family protein [bacterium]
MHEAIARMLEKYDLRTQEDFTRAIREILQELALLGLWRSKFFEKAAFYGGTALRILYGLDRFSEDLDFSLLRPDIEFDLSKYNSALKKELEAFGFHVEVGKVGKAVESPIQSAFLKTETRNHLLVIRANQEIVKQIPRGQVLKIKLEVDTDPPPDFRTHTRYLMHPIPFAVRTYVLPDLFAGKMHAALCRRWKTRVKGRDWYDLVWYVANYPEINLAHLEQRMRQSGDWQKEESLTPVLLRDLLTEAIEKLDIEQARSEVEPFVSRPETLTVWSKDFFLDTVSRIQISQ